jgi:hypothetical protein
MSTLEGYRFFSSSLLIAFDGLPTGDQTITVRMIDFAHSTYTGFLEDKAYLSVDTGYLLGLNSLIRIITAIAQEISTGIDVLPEIPLKEGTPTRLRKRKHDVALSPSSADSDSLMSLPEL